MRETLFKLFGPLIRKYVRHGVSVVVGALVTKGFIEQSTADANGAATVELVTAAVLGGINVLIVAMEHRKAKAKAGEPISPSGIEKGTGETSSTPNMLPLILLLVIPLCGCSTVMNSNKIVSVKERVFGIVVSESAANGTPQVRLGFSSTVFTVVPTQTNAVFAPKYVDTFELGQGINPFGTQISENMGTGDVQMQTNGTAGAIRSK